VLDWFQVAYFFSYFIDTIDGKPNVYSILPSEYKTHDIGLVFAFVEFIPLFFLIFAVSSIIVLPGVIAFCIEHSLNLISLVIARSNKTPIKSLLSDCQKLQLCLQMINESLAPALLFTFIGSGFQQATQMHWVIKMIEFDVSSDMMLAFLLDILVRSVRILLTRDLFISIYVSISFDLETLWWISWRGQEFCTTCTV